MLITHKRILHKGNRELIKIDLTKDLISEGLILSLEEGSYTPQVWF